MNKKADTGDKLMFFPFLFLLVIIGIGIVIGVFIFFSQGYDFREGESQLLVYKIKKCISSNEMNNEFSKNFFTICKLNQKIIEKNNIIKICKNSNDCISETNDDKILFTSGSNFVACSLKGAKDNPAYPRCYEDSLKKNNEVFTIITGSNQLSRRILT